MAKKGFKDNPAMQFISVKNQEKQEQEVREVQEVQEKQEEIDNNIIKKVNKEILSGTQGRKGHKHKRINMAFTPDNHEYIRKASRQNGLSITEFVNNIITEYRLNSRVEG